MKIIKHFGKVSMPSQTKPSTGAAQTAQANAVPNHTLCSACHPATQVTVGKEGQLEGVTDCVSLNLGMDRCDTPTGSSSIPRPLRLPSSLYLSPSTTKVQNAVAQASSSRPKPYSALWVKHTSNGLTAQFQRNVNNSDKMRVIVDSRTPMLLLIDNEAAFKAFTILLAASFAWLALKGAVAVV
ncbi:hypothetical protein NMY22_g16057 [Coprinellus aureogranulatus]|nr:hypothetical protein NMY22_g16057 [Coprinellus aureogranulatus]